MRIQAIPLRQPVQQIGIGVQLTRTTPRQTGSSSGGGGGGGGEVGVTAQALSYGNGQCNWLVSLVGVAGSSIEWAATWDGMDGDFAGAVYFEETLDPTGPAQIVSTLSGSVTGIIVYATVNGTTYQVTEALACQI